MAFGTGLAIYFIIWWVTLFISLPFRMQSQLDTENHVPGTDPAAPQDPQMLRRFLWNSVLAGFVFFIFWFVVYYLGYGVDEFPTFIPTHRYEG